jgi:hypothetical protein
MPEESAEAGDFNASIPNTPKPTSLKKLAKGKKAEPLNPLHASNFGNNDDNMRTHTRSYTDDKGKTSDISRVADGIRKKGH